MTLASCVDNWTCPIFTKNTGIYRYILFKLFTALLVESHVANVSMNKYRLLFGDDDGDIIYIKKNILFGGIYIVLWMNSTACIDQSAGRREKNEMKWNDEWVLQQPSLVKKDLAGTKRLLLFSLRPPEGNRVPLICGLNLLHLNLCWRTAERRRSDVKLRHGSNFKHNAPLLSLSFLSAEECKTEICSSLMSLFLVIAMAARARGPCWVKW